MDLSSFTGSGLIPTNTNSLMQTVSSGSLALGSPLTVPAGMGVMLLYGTEPLDLLGPGQHVIGPGATPLLAQRLQYASGALPYSTPQATALMLPNPGPVTISWQSQSRINLLQGGLMGCNLSWHMSLQIADPRRLYSALLAGWPIMLSQMLPAEAAMLRDSPMDKAAYIWLTRSLSQIIATALPSVGFTSQDRLNPSARVSAAANQALTQWLWGAGLELAGLTVDPITSLGYVNCDGCGISSKPSQYGTYRRVISVVFMRFTQEKKGHFCTTCAAKFSAEYNLVMLACGWWGVIGMIMTPIFIINNCYQFCKTAIVNRKQEASLSVTNA